MTFDTSHPEVREAVRRALTEDIGSGDVTSEACVPAGRTVTGHFIARQKLVVAGVELLPVIYAERGGVENLTPHICSGGLASNGDCVAS
ncbi:MAG: nicotinate-nucleotide diphosphorylase (carboxylating), partial [bacterium]|nr:nicotinate-nucleotide diphosphorylase (carboxylating) [bacterium]